MARAIDARAATIGEKLHERVTETIDRGVDMGLSRTTSRAVDRALRACVLAAMGLILMASAPAAFASRWSIVPVKAPVRHVPAG
jgi:hypothetical protein